MPQLFPIPLTLFFLFIIILVAMMFSVLFFSSFNLPNSYSSLNNKKLSMSSMNKFLW